jgi:amidohydrolase
MNDIVEYRRNLHRHPELAGQEAATSRRAVRFFAPLAPDRVLEGLGGHGVAFVFAGAQPGPTVLLRCELDALPIAEAGDLPHRSDAAGVSHKCGHDGHMAILAALGRDLAVRRPVRGRVVLLHQPAEETGQGAAAVLADPRFAEIAPDLAFALHNLPGHAAGEVVVREGAFSSASRGLAVALAGATAHAGQPETGRSPARALARIVAGLAEWAPADAAATDFATVVGARLGERAFGTAPGAAELWATLRAGSDAGLDRLAARALELVAAAAAADGIGHEATWHDVFPATVNDPAAVAVVRRAAGPLPVRELTAPLRWSEDFGRFTAAGPGALFGLGAGREQPALHDPDYDFPDGLIPPASALLRRIVDSVLG